MTQQQSLTLTEALDRAGFDLNRFEWLDYHKEKGLTDAQWDEYESYEQMIRDAMDTV